MPRLSSHQSIQDARFSQPVCLIGAPVTVGTDANVALTAAQVLSGWIFRSGITAARTDTLPTAAQLCEGLQGVTTNTSFVFRIRNVGAGAFAQTLAVGAGGTLAAGNTVTCAQNNEHSYTILITNATPGQEAYTLYSNGPGAGF